MDHEVLSPPLVFWQNLSLFSVADLLVCQCFVKYVYKALVVTVEIIFLIAV